MAARYNVLYTGFFCILFCLWGKVRIVKYEKISEAIPLCRTGKRRISSAAPRYPGGKQAAFICIFANRRHHVSSAVHSEHAFSRLRHYKQYDLSDLGRPDDRHSVQYRLISAEIPDADYAVRLFIRNCAVFIRYPYFIASRG